MKTLPLILLLSLVSLPLIAQEDIELRQQKNQIDLDISDLPTAFFSFSYERAIGKHISVGLGVGFKSEDGLIQFSGIDTDRIQTNDITYSGYKLIPEFRYYINESVDGSMLSGFYVGAYLKYSDFNSDLEGTYVDSQDISHLFKYEAEITVTSVGLMIGYKLPVSKRFSIDFLIAGPGSGGYDFKLDNVIAPPDEFYDDLNNALDEYSVLDLIGADFGFNNNNLRSKFSALSFRYGISVGYSF
ncbi:DUF3575 domain-containing protein [Winogradskyella sp. UBA3174]|uniref:DUF3575 domain-containing protein n=1 Tax=Winogradskyella sp. UBA3174 TaxID=1947785 RepID=UPI0025CE267A|nr:DUF3575 domain-containing protein [Winogradskyella sp. UBA3174]|tara:strand:- start:11339 stop:12067 length:729 start_codon:yes stop_codon:yes gene_type:complete